MLLNFLVPKEMVSTSSVRLFIMDYFTLVNFSNYCSNFFKNQTKPLVKLAKAAERFEGDYVNDFRASGSKR